MGRDIIRDLYEAQFYSKLEGGNTVCSLCPRRCRILPGGTGACLARRNEEGVLYSANYGKASSISLDPIEKKPLNKFYPGSMILSVGSFGCNFKCPFCQNHQISQNMPDMRAVTSDALVQMALSARANGNIGIAYTYNEPIVWYEFVKETAELAVSFDLQNVLVTNGSIEPEPLKGLLPFVAAMNIDLKGDDLFYRELCGGDRQIVLNTIEAAFAAGCHVEVTTLLVTGRNDNPDAVLEVARLISAISEEIPLHLSRFFPRYHMPDALPTDIGFVLEAERIARQYLKYVYPGNV